MRNCRMSWMKQQMCHVCRHSEKDVIAYGHTAWPWPLGIKIIQTYTSVSFTFTMIWVISHLSDRKFCQHHDKRRRNNRPAVIPYTSCDMDRQNRLSLQQLQSFQHDLTDGVSPSNLHLVPIYVTSTPYEEDDYYKTAIFYARLIFTFF